MFPSLNLVAGVLCNCPGQENLEVVVMLPDFGG